MRVRHRLMTHPPFFYQYDSGDAKQLLFNMFFLSLYPLLFFPAHGKILAWAGRKYLL